MILFYIRGHPYKLFPHYSRIDARKLFLSERITELWNSLPAKPEHFRSLAV